MSEETKDKIREKALGRKHTNETKQKIRKARFIQNCPRTGLKHTQKSKDLIKKNRTGEEQV